MGGVSEEKDWVARGVREKGKENLPLGRGVSSRRVSGSGSQYDGRSLRPALEG